jgi:nucleotidyltransferase substrate binding protein (TIGR01987 family)
VNVTLESFERAVARLTAVLREPDSMTQREASVHCFEFAFELGWKSIQRALKPRGVDVATPRDSFAQAWRLGWIDDEESWIDMMRDRNMTSHTYKEDVALAIYARIPEHLVLLSQLSRKLKTV